MIAEIPHIEADFPITEFQNSNWEKSSEVLIEKYWSGETAPEGRHFKTKLLWSDSALYIRFEANQNEPLIIAEKPNLKTKTHGLWERDVCEIFIAPVRENPRRYFEFEISPSGEWIDLAIHQLPDKRETDFGFDSGMQSAAKIEKDKVWMTIKIEWKAFGEIPKTNDTWRGNILRCVGEGATRGYLSWSPTETELPNFHVPQKFGEFKFIK